MAVSSQDVVSAAAILLNDTSFTHWTEAELLNWLNMGQMQIVILKPDANVVASEYMLAPGTMQSLPDGSANFQDAVSNNLPAGIQLLDIALNMGTDGLTPGRSVKFIDKELLDAIDPTWHQSQESAQVKYVMYDQKTPRMFYVSPPQPSSTRGYLAVVYSAAPSPCAAVSDGVFIGLSDEYKGALVDYILYRAYSKDSDSVDGANRAIAYYNAFLDAIDRKDLKMRQSDPNIKSPSASVIQ